MIMQTGSVLESYKTTLVLVHHPRLQALLGTISPKESSRVPLFRLRVHIQSGTYSPYAFRGCITFA